MNEKKSTFKVLFYLKKKAERADGKVPVMLRITVDGEIAQMSAKLFVTPELWDLTAGKVSGKSAEAININLLLEQIKARIVNHYNRILQEDDFVTAEKVKNAFLGIGVMNNSLMKDFTDFNVEFEKMVKSGSRSPSTYTKYKSVYTHLSNFLKEKHNRTDIAYRELTENFVNDFDAYLRDIKRLSHNTVWMYMMPLLHFTSEAWKNGIIKTDPFRNYDSASKETDRIYLTEEELQKVATVELRLAQTQLVRDIYLFCCWTGLSHTDVCSLSFSEIQKSDFDGRYWIITRRNKSEVSSNIPLLDIPLKIIEKYKGLAKGNKVFPVPSDKSCNTQLLRIAVACGIQKEFTFHSSRHIKISNYQIFSDLRQQKYFQVTIKKRAVFPILLHSYSVFKERLMAQTYEKYLINCICFLIFIAFTSYINCLRKNINQVCCMEDSFFCKALIAA